MLHFRRFLRCPGVLLVLNTSTILTQFNLPLDHVLVEPQMTLASKQPILEIYALNLRRLRAPPDLDRRAIPQQIRHLLRRRIGDVILVHLVQEQLVLFRAEQFLAQRRQFDLRVRQLPLAAWRRLDCRAQHPA